MQYVAVNRGMAGHVKAVMSSQGAARCASDWRVLAVLLRRVTVRYGEVGYGSYVMAKLVKFGLGVECYGSRGVLWRVPLWDGVAVKLRLVLVWCGEFGIVKVSRV